MKKLRNSLPCYENIFPAAALIANAVSMFRFHFLEFSSPERGLEEATLREWLLVEPDIQLQFAVGNALDYESSSMNKEINKSSESKKKTTEVYSITRLNYKYSRRDNLQITLYYFRQRSASRLDFEGKNYPFRS